MSQPSLKVSGSEMLPDADVSSQMIISPNDPPVLACGQCGQPKKRACPHCPQALRRLGRLWQLGWPFLTKS
jgi:hypothetical protein